MKLSQPNNLLKNKISTFVGGLFLVAATVTSAAQLEKEFFLTSEAIYMSNPSYAGTDEQSVGIFMIQPELKLTYLDELDKFYLNSLLSVYRNSNENVFPDRENPTVIFGWERELRTGLVGLEVGYNEQTAVNAVLQRVGDDANNFIGTGGLFQNEIRTLNVNGRWNYEINDRFTIKNTAFYNDVTNSERSSADLVNAGIGFVDFQTMGITSRLLYLVSQRLSAYTELGYENFKPDFNGFDDTKITRARVGAVSLPFEGAEVDANIGMFRSSGQQSGSGLLLQLKGTYEQERMLYEANVSRDLQASGINGVQEMDLIFLQASYLLSEVQTVGAKISHQKTKQDIGLIGDITFQEMGVFYEHQFEQFSVRVDAIRSELNNFDNNQVGIKVIYGGLVF